MASAAIQEAKRRLTIEATSRGLKEAAADARALGTAVDGVAVASERSTKSTVSMERAWASVQRRYDSNIRAQQEMARVERVANQAQAQGLATMQERMLLLSQVAERHGLATSAINREKVATDALASSTMRLNAVNQNTRGAGSFQTANIAAQFQDIGVTAAMGMSPLQIALQQGTQLSAILNTMENPVRGLAAAFMSVINPVSLVTIGVIGLGAAAIQYFTSAKDEVNSLDATMKAHDDAIRALKDAYGEAASGVKAYLGESREVAQALTIIAGVRLRDQFDEQMRSLVEGGELVVRNTEAVRQEIDRLKADLSQAVEMEAYTRLSAELTEMVGQFRDISVGALAAHERFAPFHREIDAFIATVQRGQPDVVALRRAIAERINAEQNARELALLADEVFRLVEETYGTQSAMRSASGAIDMIGAAAGRNIGNVDELGKSLAALAGIAVPAMSNAQRIEAEFRRGMANVGENSELGSFLLQQRNAALTRDRLQREGAMVPIPTARPNDIDRLGWFRDERGAGRQTDPWRDLTKNARDHIEAMRAVRETMGMAGIDADPCQFRADILEANEGEPA